MNLLYDDLEFVIDQLNQSKNIYYEGMINNPKQGEDLINVTICSMLSSRGWCATHDTNSNGHADIVVTLPYTDYRWIGEGKILRSNSHLYQGLKQLLYRYSTGVDNQNSGGLIAYIKDGGKDIRTCLNNWLNFFNNKDETVDDDNDEMPYSPIVNIVNPCPKNPLAFYTYHKHPSSGLEYSIRHMMIDFRYHPKDSK